MARPVAWAKSGLLLHLADVTAQTPQTKTTELWSVTKNDRELRCVVAYLPMETGLSMADDNGCRESFQSLVDTYFSRFFRRCG